MHWMGENPRISIVIPTYNCKPQLQRVLEALERQDLDVEMFEVIVVDDRSTDGTRSLLEYWSVQTVVDLKRVEGTGYNPGAARNLGVQHARGQWILFLDADVIPHRSLVRHHLEFHENHINEAFLLMGRIEVADELLNQDQVRFIQWQKETRTDIRLFDWWEYRTPNSSLSRVDFEQSGGFETDLTQAEDSELAFRLWKRGTLFRYDNRIRAMEIHPMPIETYLQKANMYGKNIARWYHRTPELRRFLSRWYGVTSPVMSPFKRLKYSLRVMIVNRYTIQTVLGLGRRLRLHWYALSQRLYRCAYGYYVRHSFRQTLKSIQKES